MFFKVELHRKVEKRRSGGANEETAFLLAHGNRFFCCFWRPADGPLLRALKIDRSGHTRTNLQ